MQILNFLEFYILRVNFKRYCECRMLPIYISPTFSCWHHCPSYCGLLFERYRVRIFVIWVTIPCSFYIAHLHNCTEYITQKATVLNFTSAKEQIHLGTRKYTNSPPLVWHQHSTITKIYQLLDSHVSQNRQGMLWNRELIVATSCHDVDTALKPCVLLI